MDMYGERLRLRRRAKGLSQSKLGQLAGCTGRCIARHETYGRKPKSEVVARIEGVLGEF